MSVTVVLASANPGKIVEFRRMVPDWIDLVPSTSLGITLPPERGRTFRENAEVKARSAAADTNLPALGDDSGLEVDALGGDPGVLSARYAGEGATDSDNVEKLLTALRTVPPADRSAHFRCVIVLAHPDGTTLAVEGRLNGVIGSRPRGENGFGYDPVFVIDDGRTLAELPAEEKDAMSHRGQALRALVPHLEQMIRLHDPRAGRR